MLWLRRAGGSARAGAVTPTRTLCRVLAAGPALASEGVLVRGKQLVSTYISSLEFSASLVVRRRLPTFLVSARLASLPRVG